MKRDNTTDLEERINKVVKYCSSLLNVQTNPAIGIDVYAAVRKQVAQEVLILLGSLEKDNVTNPKAESELS